MFNDVNDTFMANGKQTVYNDPMKENEIDRLLRRLAVIQLSEAEFARTISESPQTIHNWKTRGQIPGKKILKVAATIGVSPDWLQNGAGPVDARNYERLPTNQSPSMIRDHAAKHPLVEKLESALHKGSLTPENVRMLDAMLTHMTDASAQPPGRTAGFEILSGPGVQPATKTKNRG